MYISELFIMFIGIIITVMFLLGYYLYITLSDRINMIELRYRTDKKSRRKREE